MEVPEIGEMESKSHCLSGLISNGPSSSSHKLIYKKNRLAGGRVGRCVGSDGGKESDTTEVNLKAVDATRTRTNDGENCK